MEAVRLAEDMKAIETVQSLLKTIDADSITNVEVVADRRLAEKELRDMGTLLAKWHRVAWNRMRLEYLQG